MSRIVAFPSLAAKRIVMMPSPDIPAGETRTTRKLYQFRIAR